MKRTIGCSTPESKLVENPTVDDPTSNSSLKSSGSVKQEVNKAQCSTMCKFWRTVAVKIKAECMPKFSKLISDRSTKCEGIVVRDKILRKVSETTVEEPIDTSTGTTVDTSTGTEPGNGGDDIPAGNGWCNKEKSETKISLFFINI